MWKYCLANQNLTKFTNYSALFPQVQGNAGQEIWEPKGNDAIVTRAKTHLHNSKDICALTTVTMPSSLG